MMLTICKTNEIANVKWTVVQITTFLELLKKYQCLWRLTHADRKNKHCRDVAFENLLDEVQEHVGPNDLDMDTMKSKMKNLKTVYSRELAKVLKSEKNGESYVPGLRWYAVADSFLRHSKEAAKEITLSTVDIHELFRNELNQSSVSDPDCEVVESIDVSHNHNDPSDISFDDSSSGNIVISPSASMKPKLVPCAKLLQSPNSVIHFSKESSNQKPVKRKVDNGSIESVKTIRLNCDPEDQFVAFGLYVAAELRQLSDETQLKLAKHYINSILFDASMSALLPP